MLNIHFDTTAFARLGERYVAAAAAGPVVVRRALKHSGDKARTEMRRALVGQTGLPARTMVRAIKGKLLGSTYVIESRGGNVRLKFFNPRETKAGIVHRSPNRASPIAGAFQKGGQFPNRHGGPHGGKGVYRRTGVGRFPLRTERSDVWIPREMVTGPSAVAFFETASTVLPDRMLHEMMRLLK